jgi:hypothetical protein
MWVMVHPGCSENTCNNNGGTQEKGKTRWNSCDTQLLKILSIDVERWKEKILIHDECFAEGNKLGDDCAS